MTTDSKNNKIALSVEDNFNQSVNNRWVKICTGGGTLSVKNSILRMAFNSAQKGHYTDVQLDDYSLQLGLGLPFQSRFMFPWKPPLRMTVRARSSLPAATPTTTDKNEGILQGTAGFGFWNNPFSVKGEVLTFPESVWFFYSSPPSNMALVPSIPGWGWKAQVVHAMRPGIVPTVIPTVITSAAGLITGKMGQAAHWMQKLAGAHEALLEVCMTDWHTYTLEWRKNEAIFWVDNELVLHTSQSPSQSLGFVAWLDNQYAIATPGGVFKFGTIDTGKQWLEMDSIKIEPL